MVRIRLKRFGALNQPQWRIVVADVKSPRDGRFIEELGSYNPLRVENNVEVNEDRLQYWLKQGAQPSESVKALIKRTLKKTKKSAA